MRWRTTFAAAAPACLAVARLAESTELYPGGCMRKVILLIDFIAAARERGDSVHDALIGSVRVRTRPSIAVKPGLALPACGVPA